MPRRRTLTSSCWSSRSTRTAPASPGAASSSTRRTPRPGARTTTWRRPSGRRSCSPGPLARTATPPPRRQLRLLTWGLVPSWSKDPGGGARMINARVESVADKPAFARALASRRCLVPARGWYEWQASPTALDAKGKPRKQPFFTSRVDGAQRRDGRPLRVLARPGGRRPRRPARLADHLHGGHRARRAGPGPHPRPPAARPRAARSGPPGSTRPPGPPTCSACSSRGPPGRFTAYPVSRAVSSNRSNGPHLLDPLPAEELVGVVDPMTGEVLGGRG